MADISLIKDDPSDDTDEGFEQGDGPSEMSLADDRPFLERVKQCLFSPSPSERQRVVDVLLEVFADERTDELSSVLQEMMDLVMKEATDDEDVGLSLLQHLSDLAEVAAANTHRCPDLHWVLGDHLLPLVVQHISDTEFKFQRAAEKALLVLMGKKLLNKAQVEIHVCPTVLAVASQLPLLTLRLMCKMLPLLGRDVAERVFLDKFCEICASESNVSNVVREACPPSLCDFCAVVSPKSFEKSLLPLYVSLCKDDKEEVRAACSRVITAVSCTCSSAKRQEVLVPTFTQLLQDQSLDVRVAALRALGPFISTFAEPKVTTLRYNEYDELVLANENGGEFSMIREGSVTHSSITTYYRIFDTVHRYLGGGNCLGDEVEKREGIIMEKSFTAVSRAMFGTDVRQQTSDTNANSDRYEEGADPDFQGLDAAEEELQNQINATNNKGCDNQSEMQEDDLVRKFRVLLETDYEKVALTEVDNKEASNEILDNREDGTNESDLQQYNSYNFWYVSPELPLDASSVGADQDSTSQDNSNSTVKNLSLYSTFSFDNSISKAFQNEDKVEVVPPEPKKPLQDVVPQVFLDHFLSMTDPKLMNDSIHKELAYQCAFAMPGVLLTLGRSNWHLLKDTVELLAANVQYKVRLTVASSLFEMAAILGTEIASEDLTPIFYGFFTDLDEVRVCILAGLANFLTLITPAKRKLYLPKLAKFLNTDNKTDWRFRQELAEQLRLILPLYCPGDVNRHIGKFAVELLCDNVAAVREVALLLVTDVLKHISKERGITCGYLVKLAEKFAHSKMWKCRQSFALLCAEVLKAEAVAPELFADEMMPHLLDLSWDPVPNVRLVVARTISQHIVVNDYFSNEDNLLTVLRRLLLDKDFDVRQASVFKPKPS